MTQFAVLLALMSIFCLTPFVFSTESQVDSEGSVEGEQLKYVFYIFRHGARAPGKLGDKKIDSLGVDWSALNDKDLTSGGLRQHYLLGLSMWERYSHFLSSKYRTGEIEALTSDRQRSLESYVAHQQGLFEGYQHELLTEGQRTKAFPPGEVPDEIRKISLENYYPVGTHPTPIFASHELFPEETYLKFKDLCKGAEETDEDIYLSERVERAVSFIKQYKTPLLNMGFALDPKETDEHMINERVEKLRRIRDAFIADYFDGRLPKDYFIGTGITIEAFYKDLQMWYNYDKFLKNYKYKEGYNARVLISRLFDNIINHSFQDRIDREREFKGEESKMVEDKEGNLIEERSYNYGHPKMTIYSMHDTEMVQIMTLFKYALGTEFQGIEFAASYNFELLKVEPRAASIESKEFLKEEIKERFLEEAEAAYDVRILYNKEEIYRDSLVNFKSKISEQMISDEEINAYCGFSSKN